jgi:hypothetical protein
MTFTLLPVLATLAGAEVPGWPVGFQNSATGPDLGFYAARSYSFDGAAEDGSALDPLPGEVCDRVVGPGRGELAAALGASSVVVVSYPARTYCRCRLPKIG